MKFPFLTRVFDLLNSIQHQSSWSLAAVTLSLTASRQLHLRAVVEVDGAAQRLPAAAVAQVFGRVSKAMVVSVEQRVPAVGSCQPPVFRPVGARAAGQVQRAAHFSWTGQRVASFFWLCVLRGRGGLMCAGERFGVCICVWRKYSKSKFWKSSGVMFEKKSPIIGWWV